MTRRLKDDDAASAHALLLDALVAREPSAAIPLDERIFAPFIGSWDLVVRWFDAAGGMTREEAGEWHFAWVLEGRGVQDVWIVPPRGARGGSDLYEYGTSIRFHDPRTGAWRSTWIGPMHRMLRSFIARRLGSAVVLETDPGIEPAMRWSFADITERSFTWTNEILDEGGWRVQQTFEARRREAAE